MSTLTFVFENRQVDSTSGSYIICAGGSTHRAVIFMKGDYMSAARPQLSRVLSIVQKGMTYEKIARALREELSPLEIAAELLALPNECEEGAGLRIKTYAPEVHELFLLIGEGDKDVECMFNDLRTKRHPISRLGLEIEAHVKDVGEKARRNV